MLVGALLCAARVMPARPTVRFGELLGALVGRLDRRRHAVATTNLELAYGPALDAPARRRIVAGVYRHLGRFLFEELLLLANPKLRPLSRFIRLDGVERTRDAATRHGAVIIVALHQGHWDLLGGAISEQVAPLNVVMQPMRNPALNVRIVELRKSLGLGLIERENAVVALFRCLRRGHSVGLVCDLDQEDSPAFVDFFGIKAATVRTPAVLAIRTGKPIVVVASWSLGGALHYAGELALPLLPDPNADPVVEEARLLCEMNRQCEAFVRAHPEQWNWIHPRWKTRPPEERATQPPRAS
ncbi:MAG: hypothetical protein EXS13_11385 [Planctomycetes bacterium]|nr:hypothetical protein [Planctomycetota bacterium]